MAKYIITHAGMDGLVAAALLLKEFREAGLAITSGGKIASCLQDVLEKKPIEVHICGVGIYGSVEDVAIPLRALKRAGVRTIWYCGGTYLDSVAPELAKLARLEFDHSGRHVSYVILDSLRTPNGHSERLLQLLDRKKWTGEVAFLADLAQASVLSYFRFEDREAVPNCIRRLAFPETITDADRKLARQFASAEWVYLAGKSAVMKDLAKLIQKVAADRDSRILILGETGTGKETIARMIHESSPRSQQPFIPVNCANFTDSLLESQLFGHEKGAFTGADTRKEGVFELADGGTLFLDEIGEMPLKLQASLLRVLETGRFRRLGGKEEVRVDVRIISATHHDLLEDVKKRQFREDLYYRLSTVPVKAPALREVPEDIPHIAQDLVYRCCFSRGMQAWKLTKDQERTLRGYSWPGNVRELLNVIERAIVLGERDFSKLLNLDTERSPGRFGARRSFDPSDIRPLDQVEREYVLQVYEAAGRNKTRAAKLIGLSLNTLKKKLNEAAG
jgi:DNA-binding NtrC family response regulator